LLALPLNFAEIGNTNSETTRVSLGPRSFDKLGQAEQTWRRLLEIQNRLNGRGSQLAGVSNLQGKFNKAEPLLQQILPQLEAGIGKHSEQAISTVRQLSLAL